jgi:hypothetical protein
MLENPVEVILKDKGPRGLSLKQLSKLTGVPVRRVVWIIKWSTAVKRVDPLLHGSMKQKIKVYYC